MPKYSLSERVDNGKKSFRIRWRNSEGKSREKKFTSKRLRDRFIEENPEFYKKNVVEVADRMTFEELSLSYLDFISKGLGEKDAIRPTTAASYRGKLVKHVLPFMGRKKAGKLELKDVTDLREYLKDADKCGISPASAKMVLNFVKAAIEWGQERNYVAEFDVRKIKVAVKARSSAEEIKIYSGEEMARIISSAKNLRDHHHSQIAAAWRRNYHPMIVFLSATGLRISELLGLQWGDFDDELRSFRVERRIQIDALGLPKDERIGDPKSGYGKRTVYIPDGVSKLLLEHRAGREEWDAESWVFPAQNGSYLEYGTLRQGMWPRLMKTARVPDYGFHSLRHHYASMMLEKGASIMHLSRIMGHHDPAFTMRVYGHLRPGSQDEHMRIADLVGEGLGL